MEACLRSPPSIHLLDKGRQIINYLKRLLTNGRVCVHAMGKKQERPEILLPHKEGGEERGLCDAILDAICSWLEATALLQAPFE